MSHYSEGRIALPSMRKCYLCRKQLRNPVIIEQGYWETPRFYCSKECARKKEELEKRREEESKALNDYIKGIF